MSKSTNSNGLFLLLTIVGLGVYLMYYLNSDTDFSILNGESPNPAFHSIKVPQAGYSNGSSSVPYTLQTTPSNPILNVNNGQYSSGANPSNSNQNAESQITSKINVILKIKENGQEAADNSEMSTLNKGNKQDHSYILDPVISAVDIPSFVHSK